MSDRMALGLISPKTYPVTIAGFMSGTSLDGVDVAVITTDGEKVLAWGEALTLPYPKDFQNRLRGILGKEVITPEIVAVTRELMDYHISAYHALTHRKDIDMLAIHGHSIFHEPRGDFPRTWQICDPEYVQESIKKPILFDFRSNDIINGGEGAPLVPIFHLALAKNHLKAEKPLAFLNIGGVSNMTFIPSNNPSDMLAGDMGPGNALVNDYMVSNVGKLYDDGGAMALSGKIDHTRVHQWLKHPYFARAFPKSLDRDTFKNTLFDVQSLSAEDAVATLSELTVRAIADYLPGEVKSLILCGGGRKNAYFTKRLCEILPCIVMDSDVLDLKGDMLEAQAFAFLGARCYFGLPTSFPRTTGVAFPTVGGRLTLYHNEYV
ncbi:MAG: anhydro-N-acetylmuramic acid kinase [Alphaproteobacteria bacterium]|nr:anhydro-N-acetylmuramic acid kinase [Alphaproteobacteria bacterium]